MGQKLLVTILVLMSTVSFAQYQQRPVGYNPGYNNNVRPAGYQEVERIEDDRYDADVDNVDHVEDRGYAGENDQAGKFNGDNQASDTQNSPQINIYNANSNANKQKSAATGGYASAGSESASYANTGSGSISAARKNLEYQNNDYVVDQLEYSRLEDEKYRAQQLFNNNYSNKNYASKQAYEAVAVDNYKADNYKADNYKADNYVADTYKGEYSFWQQAYISPLIGFSTTDASVEAGMATGVGFGSKFATNFSVEGSVLYSEANLDENVYEVIDDTVYASFDEVQQYSMGVGVSYHFYNWGIFQPRIAGLLSYTYRDFNGTRYGDGSASSTAVDAGIGFGVDMSISKNVTVGAEFRWMNNLSYSRDMEDSGYNNYSRNYGNNNSRYGYGATATPIEEASTQMLLLNAKFNF